MKRKDIINIVLLVIVLSLGAYWHFNKKYTSSKAEFLLDTIIEITITTKEKDNSSLLDSTFALISKYDNELSFHKEGNFLWDINNSGKTSFMITKDVFDILSISLELYNKTDSLYDVTIGALSEIWNIDSEIIPSKEAVDQSLDHVGFDKISFSDGELIKPTGVKLDFGSIAKGFIIDKVVDHLKSKNVISAIINAGGDIRIFGKTKPLKIGIQHPRKPRNEIISVLSVQNSAVVSSGDYERFFEKEGIRYHHILNPRTGYPANNSVSVTVIAETAIIADALCTGLFLMKPEKAIELVNNTKNVEAIIFFLDKEKLKSIESVNMKNYILEKK